MTNDRDKWNRKYREASFSSLPSSIVKRFTRRVRSGRALDLACGNGRNACYLAACGYRVDAVDISLEGLNRFVCRATAINRICQDVETFAIPSNTYHRIVNTRFLSRQLFPALQEGLCPGGMLIFESYLLEPDADRQRHRRQHLLKPDELREAFPALRTIFYQEGYSRRPEAPSRKASLVAVRPSAS